MDNHQIRELLDAVSTNRISVDKAFIALRDLPYEDLLFAKIDHHRHIRQGIPEVIYAAGKTDKQVIIIAKAMHKNSSNFLITRATKKIHDMLKIRGAVFHPASRMISVGPRKIKKGNVLVLTAGTSDIGVAEEAA